MFCYEHHPKLFDNFESCSPGVVQFELDGDHDTNQLAEFSSHHQRCQGVCPRWTQAAGLCIIFSCAPTVWVPKNSWSGRKKKISRSLPAFKQQLDRWIDNCAQVLHVLRLSAARWIRCRQFWGPRFHLGRAAPMGWFVQFCLAYRYVPASYNGKSEALMDTDVSTRFRAAVPWFQAIFDIWFWLIRVDNQNDCQGVWTEHIQTVVITHHLRSLRIIPEATWPQTA